MFADSTKKTLSVIFPSTLKLNTGAAQIVKLNAIETLDYVLPLRLNVMFCMGACLRPAPNAILRAKRNLLHYGSSLMARSSARLFFDTTFPKRVITLLAALFEIADRMGSVPNHTE